MDGETVVSCVCSVGSVGGAVGGAVGASVGGTVGASVDVSVGGAEDGTVGASVRDSVEASETGASEVLSRVPVSRASSLSVGPAVTGSPFRGSGSRDTMTTASMAMAAMMPSMIRILFFKRVPLFRVFVLQSGALAVAARRHVILFTEHFVEIRLRTIAALKRDLGNGHIRFFQQFPRFRHT